MGTNEVMMSFDIDTAATVYLLAIREQLPSWVDSTWMRAGFDINRSNGEVYGDIYKKDFQAGTVSLNGPGQNNNYTVAVKSLGAGSACDEDVGAGDCPAQQAMDIPLASYDAEGESLSFHSPLSKTFRLMRSTDGMQTWTQIDSQSGSGAIEFSAPVGNGIFYRVEYDE